MRPQTEPRESLAFDNEETANKHARLIVLAIFAIVCFLLLCKNLCV